MMRLPAFRYHAPESVREAALLLAAEGPAAMIVAGGTDVFPKMKRRQFAPVHLVSLRRVAGLVGVRVGEGLTLGAATTLADLVRDGRVREGHRALARAAAQVATPQLRNMGTLGGNVCLDTRCTYYDQNEEWRRAIDFCLKKDGKTCWVAPSSPKCLAVSSTDCAPALTALDAEVRLVSAAGERTLALADFYKNDGTYYLKRRPDEVLTEIVLPGRDGWVSTYWKLRRRGSFDFPVLGVAAALRLGAGGVVEDARLVLGAVASRPLVAAEAAALLVGRALTDEAIDETATAAAKLAKPMDNTDFALHWRKAVVKPYVTGALKELRGDAVETLSVLQRRAARHGEGAALG
jgi:4-hydroxybenzoyl-CoA reductase subunit beta